MEECLLLVIRLSRGVPLRHFQKAHLPVPRTRRPFSAITSSTIRHRKHNVIFSRPTFGVPVEQAFEYARRYAAERRISAIWIDDRTGYSG